MSEKPIPKSRYAEYEVAEVRYFIELEQAALEAADLLDACRLTEDGGQHE